MALSIMSLFSGIGGLDTGFKEALQEMGIESRVVAYVEREAFSCFYLAEAMEKGVLDKAPIFTDVRDGRIEQFAGVVDCLVAGFPCQGISNAGLRKGLNDHRSGLWVRVAGLVAALQPRVVFLENVAAIRARGLDTVLQDLALLGYDARWCCLRASEVGAPHERNRWFCLAYPRGIQLRDKPRGSCGESGEGETLFVYPGKDVAEPQHSRQPQHPKRNSSPETGKQAPQRDDAIGRYAPPPDSAEWVRIAGSHPHLLPSTETEPSLRSVAHGLSRVDVLRALGNAVVPEQAKEAALRLWGSYEQDR